MRKALPNIPPNRQFIGDRRAVAAVEFAVILPFLLLLSSGVYEYSRAINASRHLTDAANSISEILATNTIGTVSYVDLHYAFDSTMLAFSEVLADSASKGVAWSSDITVSMAGVSFSPTVPGCTSACSYVANIVWTGAASGRACAAHPSAAPDTAQPAFTTLPTDLFTAVANPQGGNSPPPFSIVVDIIYNWRPLIFTKLIGSIVMKRSAYINPRYTTAVTYTVVANDDGFGQECPGY